MADHDAYHAKAMLLGMEYVDWAHAFFPAAEDFASGQCAIHADTLEPVPDDEIQRLAADSFDEYTRALKRLK